MEFIKRHPGLLSKEACTEIVQKYLDESAQEAKRTDANLRGVVKEWSVPDSDFWNELFSSIGDRCAAVVDQYLGYSPLLERDAYFLKHMTIMHHREGINVPYHYDAELSYMNGEEYIRNFAILIYLNGDFENGELMFPVQGISVKPEAGLGLIFPTSFMYPHVTNPSLGADRFVLRLGYYFKKEGIIENSKNSKEYH